MTNTNKKTIFSGVKPSGDMHLGNFIGALSKWAEIQDQYDCIFCVVDYHAITVKQPVETLNRRVIDTVKHYLASGIDLKRSVIFQQSDVSAHTELAWILNTMATMQDLLRMTQFIDKALKGKRAVLKKKIEEQVIERTVLSKEESEKYLIYKTGVGLFDYPILMAADILLYDTDAVPVGDDQVQHVELTRTLARRFNREFGETFKVPEVVIRKEGARIMGLDDPAKKMGKSESEANYIALADKPDAAAKKIMRAVTDSGKEIKFDNKNKPAISNLLTIYSILGNVAIKELEKKYQDKGYADFKKDLAEVVKKFLIGYQEKFNSYSDEEIKKILKEGAQKVRPIAEATLLKAKQKLGLYIKK